jgi:hypothetical protein
MTRQIALSLSLLKFIFKIQVVTDFFFIMEDRLTIKNKPHFDKHDALKIK